MRLGLLGDIHGNDLALAAALQSMRQAGVEELLMTGDIVGYYFFPDRVLELLAPWKMKAVRGNHEDMLASVRTNPDLLPRIEEKYGSGLRLSLESLTSEQIDFLISLPHPLDLEIQGRRVLLCHGAPWDNNYYIYPDASADLLQKCAVPGYDLIVLGHTHHPMIHKIGTTLLVNPGSVGQPRGRGRGAGAEWALFDTDDMCATLKWDAYDPAPVKTEARHRHPELPYLTEVLERT